MSERMMQDEGPESETRGLGGAPAHAGVAAMHVQHKHDKVQAQVIVVGGSEGGHAHYMACVASVKGEPWQVTQLRWDDLARKMYSMGVEPVTDEPVFTIEEGDLVYDHYVLHEIQDDRLDNND